MGGPLSTRVTRLLRTRHIYALHNKNQPEFLHCTINAEGSRLTLWQAVNFSLLLATRVRCIGERPSAAGGAGFAPEGRVRQTGDVLAFRGSLASFGQRFGRMFAARGVSRWRSLLVLATMVAPGAEAASKKSKVATPRIAASIVIDMNTGAILGAESAETPRHPASLTKMMTLYVLFGYLRAGKITPGHRARRDRSRREPSPHQARPETRHDDQGHRRRQGAGDPVGQ